MARARAVELMVVLEKNRCRILRSDWTKPVSGWLLRRPFLANPASLEPFREGDAEVQVELLDGGRAPVAAYAWRARPARWFDVIPASGELPDRRDFREKYRSPDLRTLRFPVPPGTAYLTISRNEVVSTREGVRAQTVRLNSYRVLLRRTQRPRGGTSVLVPEWGEAEIPDWYSETTHHAATREPRHHHRRLPVPVPLDRSLRPRLHGYDIVVTGDGFARHEQDSFKESAKALIEAMKKVPPFGDRTIRWHILPAISPQSGVEWKPWAPKRTYYEIFCMEARAGRRRTLICYAPTRVGRFLRGTRKVGPWSLIDLVITIVNHSEIGGHAWPDLKLIVVPKFSDASLSGQFAAHEAAHVMGQLSDEWPMIAAWEDPLDPSPNRASLCEVATSVKTHLQRKFGIRFGTGGRPAWVAPPDSVWWRSLRNDGKRRYAPVAVNLPGDRCALDIRERRLKQRVGAVWGCERLLRDRTATRLSKEIAKLIIGTARAAGQRPPGSLRNFRRVIFHASADPGLSKPDLRRFIQISQHSFDLRGMAHYRPAAWCKMNSAGHEPFCPACRTVLREVVHGTCSHPDWAHPPVSSGLRCLR